MTFEFVYLNFSFTFISLSLDSGQHSTHIPIAYSNILGHLDEMAEDKRLQLPLLQIDTFCNHCIVDVGISN